MDQDHSHHQGGYQRGFFTSRSGIVLIGFLLIAGYFLVTEHRAHLALALPYLPWLLLLACPFLHFFHGGHGHGGEDGSGESSHHNH